MKKLALLVFLCFYAATARAQSLTRSLSATDAECGVSTTSSLILSPSTGVPIASVTYAVTGTFTGTITFKVSGNHRATWNTIAVTPSGGGSSVTTTTGSGTWSAGTFAYTDFCAVATAFSSGPIVVTISLSPGGTGGGSGIVNCTFPNAVAVQNGTNNFLTCKSGLTFDGTTANLTGVIHVNAGDNQIGYNESATQTSNIGNPLAMNVTEITTGTNNFTGTVEGISANVSHRSSGTAALLNAFNAGIASTGGNTTLAATMSANGPTGSGTFSSISGLEIKNHKTANVSASQALLIDGQGAGGQYIVMKGLTSGIAGLGVNPIAGTPNDVWVPTTTGNPGDILQTDGGSPAQQTSWVAPQLFRTTTTLTSAQLKALPGTTVQVVPAPGANKLLVPQSITFQYQFVTTAYTIGGGDDAFELVYHGISVASASLSCFVPANGLVDQVANAVSWQTWAGYLSPPQLQNVVANVALDLTIDGTTPGLTLGDGTAVVTVDYYIVTLQ